MKILVVDDSRELSEVLERVLTEHGHRTLIAFDGENAWTLLQRQPDIDLVLLDLGLPLLSGRSFLHRLKALGTEASKKVPIVVFTAASDVNITTLQEFGVVEVLHKPLDLSDLLGAVNRQSELMRSS